LSESLSVPFEAAAVPHLKKESLFAAVTERRVPEVVRETRRLDQNTVRQPSSQFCRNLSLSIQHIENAGSNLRAFERVRHSSAVKVALSYTHNLCLALKSAESRRVDHTRAIPLVRGPNIAGAW
jgi:hypothetical protein